MQIYVPSAGRSDQIMKSGPISQMSPELRKLIHIIVPPEELSAYRSATALHVFSCPERGIARTRHFIGLRAAEAGQVKFCMVDDDVEFFHRRSAADWRLERADYKSVEEMFVRVADELDAHAHASVSVRQGNNRLGVGTYCDLRQKNTRTLRVLAYRTKRFLEVEHGRVEVMEDFDVNLQLLRQGHENVNIGWWAQDQKMTNAPGGCSSYRTHQVHQESAMKLAELHPGLVSLRIKKNKTGGEFGERTEVTIQWKKALGSGT